MCRWICAALVSAYVVVMGVILVVLLILLGVRMSDPVRWMVLGGWVVACAGWVYVGECWMVHGGICGWAGCRLPIAAEQERLLTLMGEVQRVAGSKMRIRFLIRGAGGAAERGAAGRGSAERPTESFGYRTILVQSGCLALASDGELKGILAHELGHLRDGDRVMEAAFFSAGVLAQVFRLLCRLVGKRFRFSAILGLLWLGVLFFLLFALFPFYLLDGAFWLVFWGLRRWEDRRQDCFAFRVGCGDGLCAWLERSGLAANVGRIRRLEKME